MKLGMVVADFNKELTCEMEKTALDKATSHKCEVMPVHVPGVLDMPLAVQTMLNDTSIQGVFVLGVVKKGDTDHDQVVAHESIRALIDLSLQFKKPVSFGIIGPNVTSEQAKERVQSYAEHAVETVVKMIHTVTE